MANPRMVSKFHGDDASDVMEAMLEEIEDAREEPESIDVHAAYDGWEGTVVWPRPISRRSFQGTLKETKELLQPVLVYYKAEHPTAEQTDAANAAVDELATRLMERPL